MEPTDERNVCYCEGMGRSPSISAGLGDDISYVLSGNGKATCDGEEEILSLRTCHICKKGSEHSIENTGDEDLVLLTIVVER